MLLSEIGAIQLESVSFKRPDTRTNARLYFIRTYGKSEENGGYDESNFQLASARGQTKAKATEHLDELVRRMRERKLPVRVLEEIPARPATKGEQIRYLDILTSTPTTGYRSPMARGRASRKANPKRLL